MSKMTLYDITIIGAGPVGSYLAYKLAESGYGVAVLERKTAIGDRICCTGIISKECFDYFKLDAGSVLREASSARFFSPSRRFLTLRKEDTQAYIVNRSAFDKSLARKAQGAGASYFLQHNVTGVIPETYGYRIEAEKEGQHHMLRTRVLVFTCGLGSRLPEWLGLGSISCSLFGIQTEVSTQTDEVEVYFDQKLAPGGFAWLVPTAAGKGLAGVMAGQNGLTLIRGLLSKLMCENKISTASPEIRQKLIPLGYSPRTYTERALVVGEAAGQVKPTTGGGVYFGLIGAELAAETIDKGFRAGDLSAKKLATYQKAWQCRIGAELKSGYLARRLYSRLNNEQIEIIFDSAQSNKIHERLLCDKAFSFDWHARLMRKLLNQPWFLPRVVTQKLLFSLITQQHQT